MKEDKGHRQVPRSRVSNENYLTGWDSAFKEEAQEKANAISSYLEKSREEAIKKLHAKG